MRSIGFRRVLEYRYHYQLWKMGSIYISMITVIIIVLSLSVTVLVVSRHAYYKYITEISDVLKKRSF